MNKVMHNARMLLLFSGIPLFLLSTPSHASAYEETDHLKEVVKAYVNANTSLAADETMDIQFDKIASLVLPACSNDIISSLPNDNNRQEITSVELTCNGTQAWHVFIPVHVAIYTKVIVAKETIAPQTFITPENVELATYEKSRLYNGYYKNVDELQGQIANQVIQSGTAISKKNIQSPIIIHRNQVVEVTAIKNLVAVTMKGIAKSDGAMSSTIKILNTSSQKTFDAVVVGPNKAEVLL